MSSTTDPVHTPTFARLLTQLHAEGREKADGFDPSHFEGLRPDEAAQAGQLLRDALLAGDGTAATGLLLLDPDGGLDALDAALGERGYPHRVGLDIAAALWARTSTPRYAAALVPYLRSPFPTARAQALFQLQHAPCLPGLPEALRAVVVEDTDETNRGYAAKKLLACLGVVARPEDAYVQARPLVLALRSPDLAVRRQALAGLDA